MSYEEKLKYVSVVATPIASKKFAKKIYKLIKKGSKQKTYVRSGLKVNTWGYYDKLKKHKPYKDKPTTGQTLSQDEP